MELQPRNSECVCQGPACATGARCLSPQCFSALLVSNGSATHRKGCVVGTEDGGVDCRGPASPELVVKCCRGQLCNANLTAELPVRGERRGRGGGTAISASLNVSLYRGRSIYL